MRGECLDRAERVLRLHAQQHDIAVTELELVRPAHDRHRNHDVLVGRTEAQPVGRDRIPMGAARDEDGLVSVAMELRADDTADGAGSVHDVAHRAQNRASSSRSGPRPMLPRSSAYEWNALRSKDDPCRWRASARASSHTFSPTL